METFIIELYQKNIIKFGNFTLKSGKQSNIYFDLRSIIAHPKLLNQMVDLFWDKIKYVDFDLICGVAYGAIPIASGICLKYGKPMLIKRREKKNYGTKKLVEGEYKKGQKCLLIDDVVTTGGSIQENTEDLEKEGLIVWKKIVFLDRQEDEPTMNDISPLITIQEVLQILNIYLGNKGDPIEELRYFAELKETRLILSADVTKWRELENLLFEVGEHICAVKIHIDIMEDMDLAKIYELKKMARTFNFLIIGDRKFSDIGNTVKMQYGGGVHRLVEWTDFVTVHGIMGPGILEAMREVLEEKRLLGKKGVLLVAEVSSKDNLIDEKYTEKIVKMTENYEDLVAGFITQHKLSDKFLNITPGINENMVGDIYDQRYKNLDSVDTDFIIVGRGIYESEDVIKAAIYYKEEMNKINKK